MKPNTAPRADKGLTVAQALITMFAIFALIAVLFLGVYRPLITDNFWLTEERVLKEIRQSEPTAKAVKKSGRGAWSDSEITVELEDGSRKIFRIDGDMLLNHETKSE